MSFDVLDFPTLHGPLCTRLRRVSAAALNVEPSMCMRDSLVRLTTGIATDSWLLLEIDVECTERLVRLILDKSIKPFELSQFNGGYNVGVSHPL